MLSLKKYVSLCILGGEVFYAGCLIYGALLPAASLGTHSGYFSLAFPGFSWGIGGFILGAVYVAVYASIFGSYMVWMHNKSIVK